MVTSLLVSHRETENQASRLYQVGWHRMQTLGVQSRISVLTKGNMRGGRGEAEKLPVVRQICYRCSKVYICSGNRKYLLTSCTFVNFMNLFRWDYSVTEEAIKEVLEELNHNLKIPCNFTLTAACYDPSKPQKNMEPVHTINPQTTEFCAQFGLTDINDRIQQVKEEGSVREYEEEEEEEEMDSTGSAEEPSEYNTDNSGLSSINPDEIMLDDEGGDEDLSTCSVDPSPDHPPEFSASFSDIRIMPDSMAVSSDDAMDSNNEELEKSGVSKQAEEKSLNERPLKRIGGNENGNTGIKKIKRRNQAIYAADDEDKTE